MQNPSSKPMQFQTPSKAPTSGGMTGWQKFISGVIVGLIVGWGGTSAALHRSAPAEMVVDTEESATKDATAAVGAADVGGTEETSSAPVGKVSGGNSLAAKDQPAGSRVEVTNVTLSESAWVVVREDMAGAPGKILGAHRYDKGMYLGDVELLRPTVAGGTYYVMLNSDDGDKEFDPAKDVALLGTDGKPVMASFKAQ